MDFDDKDIGCCRRLGRALRIFWRTIFAVVFPFVLILIFLLGDSKSRRCLYVVLLMIGYWVIEPIPLAITAMIPLVLFPMLGVLPTDKTSLCYFRDSNMLFVGGLVVALAVEHCNLHTRVSLRVIKIVGCSPRKLNFGLVTVTMFISMWISNSAATTMMIPIIEATLKALEEQGIGSVYVEGTMDKDRPPLEQDGRRPTNATMCYYISTAYAATIGGMGCIVGASTNITFKGIFETLFPEGPGISFTDWMLANIPMMLVMNYLMWIALQCWFMGLCRPYSKDYKAIDIGAEGASTAKRVLLQKLHEMGPMSFHEKNVGLCFILVVCLWFFRKPGFIPGWAEVLTDIKIKDATPAILVVILFFLIPSKPDFLYSLSSDREKRPNAPSPGLITWKVIQQKMPWNLVFLLGGGYAIAEASQTSGMSSDLAHYLRGMKNMSAFAMLICVTCLACFITQFTSNVTCASIILPVLAELSKITEVHPLYLMLPAALSCSYAYCLPVSTPSNALVSIPINMPTMEMIKIGIIMCFISLGVLWSVYPNLSPLVFDMNGYPGWAARGNF